MNADDVVRWWVMADIASTAVQLILGGICGAVLAGVFVWETLKSNAEYRDALRSEQRLGNPDWDTYGPGSESHRE